MPSPPFLKLSPRPNKYTHLLSRRLKLLRQLLLLRLRLLCESLLVLKLIHEAARGIEGGGAGLLTLTQLLGSFRQALR